MDSRIGLLVLAIFIQGQTVNGDPPPPPVSSWLCTRVSSGPLCSGQGTCNPYNGKCTCNSGIAGYDCSITATGPCTTNSGNGPCSTAGSSSHWTHCYKDANSNEKCACAPGWTGTDCNTRVSTLECDGTNFKLTYIPQLTPDGGVYPVNQKTDPACIDDPATNQWTVPMNAGACSVVTSTPVVGTTAYSVTVVFQYIADLVGGTDDRITLKCTYTSTTNIYTAEIIQTVNFDGLTGLNDAGSLERDYTTNSALTATSQYKTTKAGAYVDVTANQVAQIDWYLKLTVTLSISTAYKAIRLEHCWVDDGSNNLPVPGSWVSTTYRKLVHDACPARSGDGILMDLEDGPDNSGVDDVACILIRLMKFETTAQLRLFCKVTVCIATDTDPCETITNCAGDHGLLGTGRKRRETTSNTTFSAIAGTAVNIDMFSKSATLNQKVIHEECSMSREVIVVIVVLCILLLLLGVACVYFALRYVSKRQRRKVDDLKSVYSNNTFSTNGQ